MDEKELKYNDEGALVPAENLVPQEKRQEEMWKFYVEGLAEGRDNLSEAAVKAGYNPDSLGRILQTKWFKDKKNKLKRVGMLSKAEKNLEDILKMPYINKKTKGGEEVLEVDTDLLRIVLDTSKVVVKSLGKDEGWSERTEMTGKSGDPIVFMPSALLEKHGLGDIKNDNNENKKNVGN